MVPIRRPLLRLSSMSDLAVCTRDWLLASDTRATAMAGSVEHDGSNRSAFALRLAFAGFSADSHCQPLDSVRQNRRLEQVLADRWGDASLFHIRELVGSWWFFSPKKSGMASRISWKLH